MCFRNFQRLKHRWERLTKTHKSVSFYFRQRESSKQLSFIFNRCPARNPLFSTDKNQHSTTLPHIVIQITQKSPQTTKCSQHFAKPCIGSWEAEKISSASTDFLARLSLSNGGTGERAKKGNKFTFFLWIEM